ncbi:M23 family metallopeptidase [Puerhibacterium puerhi]|uniref:M23 family metallopeptidase n=1 Tax=Puerhibacterium puerhi TaxID=2692623 RepID=UPI0038B54C48
MREVGGVRFVLGSHVVVDHGDGVWAVYAHLRRGSVRVAPGDVVAAGQQLGEVGSSGNTSDPTCTSRSWTVPASSRRPACRSAGAGSRSTTTSSRRATACRAPARASRVCPRTARSSAPTWADVRRRSVRSCVCARVRTLVRGGHPAPGPPPGPLPGDGRVGRRALCAPIRSATSSAACRRRRSTGSSAGR